MIFSADVQPLEAEWDLLEKKRRKALKSNSPDETPRPVPAADESASNVSRAGSAGRRSLRHSTVPPAAQQDGSTSTVAPESVASTSGAAEPPTSPVLRPTRPSRSSNKKVPEESTPVDPPPPAKRRRLILESGPTEGKSSPF